jgi:hypothetical protein
MVTDHYRQNPDLLNDMKTLLRAVGKTQLKAGGIEGYTLKDVRGKLPKKATRL